MALTPSTPSLVSSPSSNISSEKGPSPLPTQNHCQADVMFPSPVSTLDTIFNFPPGPKSPAYGGTHSMGAFECGLCTDVTSCVCREMVLNPPPATPFKTETTTVSAASMVPVELPPASQIGAQSILDNLPPYQPPVPLRRRPEVRPLRSLFPIVPSSGSPSQVTQSGPVDCSGDPSNCLACADDVFGQAFCAAVGESLACSGPCADCPRASGRDSTHATPSASQEGGNSAETIPTSDAWRQLKSHPNVSFADLSLLAEVVARRSKCAGPTVVISPPPGSITPERTSSPVRPMNDPSAGGDSDVILLSDPHANYHMEERERSACSSPNLVQEELVRCSRTRSGREVHTAGVREALALLDSRF
jgi:AP-1-like factor